MCTVDGAKPSCTSICQGDEAKPIVEDKEKLLKNPTVVEKKKTSEKEKLKDLGSDKQDEKVIVTKDEKRSDEIQYDQKEPHGSQTEEKGEAYYATGTDGDSSLYTACAERNETLVKQFIKEEADLDKAESDGWTPLIKSC